MIPTVQKKVKVSKENGKPKVDKPNVDLSIQANEEVVWECDSGSYTIDFVLLSNCPFNWGNQYSREVKAGQPLASGVPLEEKRRTAPYKYYVRGDGETLDPDISVRP